MTPIHPSEFQAVIPISTDTLCQALVKVCIKFPILFWNWYSYAFIDGGSFATGFASDLCVVKANCP